MSQMTRPADWQMKVLQISCAFAVVVSLLTWVEGRSGLGELVGKSILVGYGYFQVRGFLSGGIIISGLGRVIYAKQEEHVERVGYALLYVVVIISVIVWSVFQLVGAS